jgi:hypothetical protein
MNDRGKHQGVVGREHLTPSSTYEDYEGDFRVHHTANAAKRRGSYESYRLVYRYGYDLGTDARYCSIPWTQVEDAARPRWEERNPSTWDQFEDTIRYAWHRVRRQP